MTTTMIEFDFPAATARQKLRKAQAALNHAEKLLDQHCGFIVNIALLDRIRIAARRVDRARQLVRKIDPDCPECQGAPTKNKDALTRSRSSVRKKLDEKRKSNSNPHPRDVRAAPSPNPDVGK